MINARSTTMFALCIVGTGAALTMAQPTQTPQQLEPELFEPGVVSTGLDELNAVFSPDGQELYYSINTPRNGLGVIVVSRRRSNGWSSPEVVPFSGRYSEYDPYFSPDGSRLFFISNRPTDPSGEDSDWNIWAVDRRGSEWSEPVNLGAPVNTDGNEY